MDTQLQDLRIVLSFAGALDASRLSNSLSPDTQLQDLRIFPCIAGALDSPGYSIAGPLYTSGRVLQSGNEVH